MNIKNLITIDMILEHTDIKSQLGSVGDSFNGFFSSVQGASREIGGTLDEVGTKLQRAGKQMADVGSEMTTAITVPLALIGKQAVTAGIEFESAFAGVEKTVDGTAEEMYNLSEGIKEMSTRIPASTTVIAGVAEAAGQLGIAVPDILEFTEVMVNLGVSTNLSADQAATALARVANIMELSSDDYSRMGATIVDLGNNYATTESEIVNMTMRLAASGKQVGMSTADIMGMAAGLTSLGIRAEAGGTALSKFMGSMQLATNVGAKGMKELEEQTGLTYDELYKMSSNAPKEFKKVAESVNMAAKDLNIYVKAGRDLAQMSEIAGVSTEEFANKFNEFPAEAMADFFEGLYERTKKTGEGFEDMGEAGETAIEIMTEMGINEVRLRDTIMRTGGAKELFTKAIEDANNAWIENTALTEEAQKRYETLESKIQLLKNAWNVVLIEVGEQLMPFVEKLVVYLTDLGKKIGEMSPEQFEKIVKQFLALAAAGPALMIVGNAVKLIGTGLKVFNISKNAVEHVSKQLAGITDVTGKLSKSYVEGGWTNDMFYGLKKARPELDLMINKKGQITSSIMPRVNSSFTEFASKVGISADEMSKFSATSVPALTKFRGAADSLMSSSLFKAGAWAAVIGYATTLIEPIKNLISLLNGTKKASDETGESFSVMSFIFDSIRSVIGFVVDVFKFFNNIIRDATAGVAGMTDVLAIAIGLFLGLSNPIGLAVTAIASIKFIIGLWTKDLEDSNAALYEHQRQLEVNNSIMAQAAEVVEEADTAYNKYANETLPNLLESQQYIAEQMQLSKMFPEEEDYQVSGEAMKTYLDDMVTFAKESNDKKLLDLKNSLTEKELLEDEFYSKFFETAQEMYGKEKEEVDYHYNELLELEKKRINSKEGLNKEEEDAYAHHLRRLEEIAINQHIKKAEMDLAYEKANIMARRAQGYELTEEGLDEINELVDEKTTQRLKLEKNSIAGALAALEEAHKKGEISKEEYENRTLELMSDSYRIQREGLEEKVRIAAGLTEEEFDYYVDIAEQLGNLEKKKTSTMTAEEKEKHRVRKEYLKKELEGFDLSKKEWELMVAGLKKTMPPEYKSLFDNVNDEISFAQAMRTIKTEFEGAEALGAELPKGIERGMERERNRPISAATGLGTAIKRAFSTVMGIFSPSREMADLAQWIPVGVAEGIDDNADVAIDSMRDLADGLMDEADFDEIGDLGTLELEVSRRMDTSVNSSFAASVKQAVVDGFAAVGPLPAYIGKDDAEEAFTESFLKQNTGRYWE